METPVWSSLKKGVVLQVNDAADRIRLVIFVSKVQLFYVQITEQTGWGRVERRGVTPVMGKSRPSIKTP